MFVALKIIPTIATIDTKRPSIAYNFDSPSSAAVPAVTSTSFGVNEVATKLSAHAEPGATKAPTSIDPVPATGIADDEVPPLPEWERYISFSR